MDPRQREFLDSIEEWVKTATKLTDEIKDNKVKEFNEKHIKTIYLLGKACEKSPNLYFSKAIASLIKIALECPEKFGIIGDMMEEMRKMDSKVMTDFLKNDDETIQ